VVQKWHEVERGFWDVTLGSRCTEEKIQLTLNTEAVGDSEKNPASVGRNEEKVETLNFAII
jgi:hypothetical protein